MTNLDQVAVVIYDRHGLIDEIFLDNEENAAKRCLIHNLAYFLNSESSEEDEKLAATFESLIREEKWEQVFQLWHDENMDECEFSRPAHSYSFGKTPDMKDLWIYRKPEQILGNN